MANEELKNMLFIIDTLLDDAITDSTRQKVRMRNDRIYNQVRAF